jgi:hypothetical protein
LQFIALKFLAALEVKDKSPPLLHYDELTSKLDERFNQLDLSRRLAK